MGFVGSGGLSLTLSDACLYPVHAHGEGASEACFDGRGDEAPVLDSDSIGVVVGQDRPVERVGQRQIMLCVGRRASNRQD
jgi:hypothetical protein